jgi:hypothetical protein
VNIWTRNNEASPRAASQVPALLLANQINYSNVNYSYNGATAPSFYGYERYGFNGLEPGFATAAAPFDEALFIAPAGQPTVKVTFVTGTGSTPPNELKPAPLTNEWEKLFQKAFEAVPVPELGEVPSGRLSGESTDAPCCIYQPSAGKMWDIWRLIYSEAIGGWTCQYGAYIGPGSQVGFNGLTSEWNGIYHVGVGGITFGTRASGLVDIGGMISLQDIVEVLRGGKIKHALAMIVGTTNNVAGSSVHVAPATKNDDTVFANTHPYLPDNINAKPFTYVNKIPNGAYGEALPLGFVDGVPEGTWVMFPPASRPSEYGITGVMGIAIFEALREYGMVINDRTGSGCALAMESAGSLGSSSGLCSAKVNPFAGYTYGKYGNLAGFWGHGYTAISQFIPSSWTDAKLATLEEPYSGTASFVMAQPWKELELLEPFSS